MDKSRRAGGERIWFVCCFLVTFLLIFYNTRADGVIKQVSDPTGNVNLTPFEQWISAYECLLNTSKSCSDKYQLTEQGWVNVTQVDTDEYCKSGCVEHTRAVLTCIHLVKRDYKFIDKRSVYDINETITLGCDHGFSGVAVYSNARRRFYESKSAIFSSMVAVLSLITYFNM